MHFPDIICVTPKEAPSFALYFGPTSTAKTNHHHYHHRHGASSCSDIRIEKAKEIRRLILSTESEKEPYEVVFINAHNVGKFIM